MDEKEKDVKGNTGLYNTGVGNCGNSNAGSWNKGNYNTGNHNTGDWNSYSGNSGDFNSGGWNSGSFNSGDRNVGDWNSGCRNYGNHNSGDWNTCNYSSGCFNTFDEQKIYMFNKPSNWTYRDWATSYARRVLNDMPSECGTRASGWLDKPDEGTARLTRERQKWWQWVDFDNGSAKAAVLSLPNFDKAIFKEITGIDVDAEWID